MFIKFVGQDVRHSPAKNIKVEAHVSQIVSSTHSTQG